MAIRYDKDLNRLIKRSVDAFNKKRNRAEAQNLKYLPSKQTIKGLKEEFGGKSATRRELYRRLNELNKFNLKTAKNLVTLESGEKTSQYNLYIAKKQQNRLRRKMVKNIQEQEDMVYRHPELIMRRSRLSLLKNIRESLLGKIKTRDTMRSISAHYNREFSPATLDNFYDNFFEMMREETSFIGIDKEKVKYIEDKLKSVKPEILLKMRNNSPYISMILEKYDSDKNYNQYDVDEMNEMYDRLYQNIDNIIDEFTDEYELL